MIDAGTFNSKILTFPSQDNERLYFKSFHAYERNELQSGFQKLSQRSVYHRFMGYIKELSNEQLDALTNLDNINRVAWVSYSVKKGVPYGIGIGRFSRSASTPNEAEIALTVIDEFQNKGVGTILFSILYYLGGQMGISTFTGIILASNLPLILRFQDMGAMMCRYTNEYEMRLPVHTDFSKIPDSRYSKIVIPILKELKMNFCAK